MISTRTVAAAIATAALALPAAAGAKPKTTYMVSLGDSWAQGVQPIGPNQADIATNQGFNDVLYKKLRKTHPGLKHVKLGCGGATTDSMINGTRACGEKLPYASRSKATSQLTYAGKFLRAHRAKIAFVTVIIGGNDVAPCASKPTNDEIVACTSDGIGQIKKNISVISSKLRAAAGKKAVIVGSTYADVVLGQYLKGDNGKAIAELSVGIFRDQINPTLKSGYAKQKIGFVDATAGFGGYIPFDQTTELEGYGKVPQAVANICNLGWYCTPRSSPDIHLKPAGYAKLADLFATQVKKTARR
jgi:lysophospholipase L1-like esterase